MGCTCKEGGEACGYCQMLSTAPRLTSLREYAQAFVTAFDSGRAYKSQLQGLRDALGRIVHWCDRTKHQEAA